MKQENISRSSVTPTPQELATLDEGIESARTQKTYSLEEAFEFARGRRKSKINSSAEQEDQEF